MPADTPDYMAPAWASCMEWAIGQRDIVDRFIDQTGQTRLAPKGSIDALVDHALGLDRKFVEAFIRWANREIWGPMA
jgi:hypothetical protein